MKLTNDLKSLHSEFDLIIQLIPDPAIVEELEKIEAPARSGVRNHPHFHIQGSWAQLYMAMLGAKRYTPFTLKDVFAGIIDGGPSRYNATQATVINKSGKILIDQDLGNQDESLAALIQDLYRAFPGRVEEYSSSSNLEKVYAYIGTNTSLASFVSYFGGIAVHLLRDSWDLSQLPSSTHAWNVPADQKMDINLFHQMTKLDNYRIQKCFRLTNEYLSNLFLPPTEKPIDDNHILFDHVLYVAFNFITDLREVDIPIPRVTCSLLLKNKGIVSVLNKISHLNTFGIKFIQDFFDSEQNSNEELVRKIAEIDDLTNRSLAVYPELDLIRHYFQFLKAKVPGDNFNEVAKNMILTFSEINQIIGCIENLLSFIVKENQIVTSHTR
ncbi:MAG: hypothetical protein LW878_05785 [Proteobacteria bacterium]|nr:hypothetical protein [Pseudomonadota bacterium]